MPEAAAVVEPVPVEPASRAYTFAMATSSFGAALSFLAITVATTLAGGAERAGLYTAAVTAAMAIASAAGTALTPRISHGRGSLSVMQAAQVACALALAVGGVLLTLGLPVMPVLFLAVLPVGFANGVEVVLRAPFARQFMGQSSTSQAYARLGAVAGVAYAAGSLLGGVILPLCNLGFGLIANAVLLLPLVVMLLRMDAAVLPPPPAVRSGVWATTRASLAASPTLRLAALTVVVATLLVLPFQRLVTPLVTEMRPGAVIAGAAAVLAAASLGMILAPRVVRVLARGRTEEPAMVVALLITGVTIVLFGLAGLLPAAPLQVVLLVLVSFVMGAFRQAYGSLRAGVTSEARGGEHQVSDLASMALIGRLVFPVGLMVWGVCFDLASATGLLVVAGGIAVVASLALLGRARQLDRATSDEGVETS